MAKMKQNSKKMGVRGCAPDLWLGFGLLFLFEIEIVCASHARDGSKSSLFEGFEECFETRTQETTLSIFGCSI